MKYAPSFLLLCFAIMLLVAACQTEQPDSPTTVTAVPATPEASTDTTEEPVSEQGAEAPERGQEDSRLTSPTGATSEIEELEEESTTQGGGVVFSAPFEVRPDGFSFRNYSTSFPEGRFTIRELRAQFGDDVCSRIDEEDVCIPTAEAQQWIDDRNADMSYGHCIGFTVVSYRFAEGDIEPAAFTPGADVPFDIERDIPIMRQISANGALYWARSVWSSEVGGTPREVLDALIALAEPVDLSIYLPGLVGGHSLLAYGVEEVEPDQYRIHVYDNNFPGQELFVEVDYVANTWRYDQGAVNPDMTSIPYTGDATTGTLRFIPLSAYDNVPCPFCILSTPASFEDEVDDDSFTLLSFLGDGEVLVMTTLGNIGMVAGQLINEIPGASFIFGRGQLAANDAPDIVLPAGLDYTVEFTGLERVSSLSQGYSLVLRDLQPVTETSTLAVALAEQRLDYKAGADQKPVIRSTVHEEDASYTIALLGIDYEDGQTVSIGASRSDNGLEISSPDADITDATLLIARLTDESESVFATTELNVVDGGSVALDVGTWDGGDQIDLYSDENGDGEYSDPPQTLPNQPLTDVLQAASDDQVADVIDKLSPFIGSAGIDALLAGLAAEELSGLELGEILRPLDLSTERLTAFLLTLQLPTAELADLLFALRLDAEQLAALIESLVLPADEEAALLDALAELALFEEIKIEWEFLDSADMSRLAKLLNARDFSVAQLARLLPRLGLSTAQLEQVVTNLSLTRSALESLADQLGLELVAALEVTSVLTPTLTVTATITATPTPRATASGTATVTTTPAATPATPRPTATSDAYPGAPPPPTPTPAPYPYPYPGPPPTPSPTRPPANAYPYPGPQPTATPAFDSRAFCSGNDLRVVAEEPTWIEADVEIWAGEMLLLAGQTGPEGEPFEARFVGPDTWTELFILSSVGPRRVNFRSPIVCPNP